MRKVCKHCNEIRSMKVQKVVDWLPKQATNYLGNSFWCSCVYHRSFCFYFLPIYLSCSIRFAVLLCVSVDAVFHYSFIHVTKCTSATITKINHTVYQKHTTKAIPFPISTEWKTPSHFSHTVFCSFSIVLFCKRIRVQ